MHDHHVAGLHVGASGLEGGRDAGLGPVARVAGDAGQPQPSLGQDLTGPPLGDSVRRAQAPWPGAGLPQDGEALVSVGLHLGAGLKRVAAVAHAMELDLMALGERALDQFRMAGRALADDEERGADPLARQRVEDARGPALVGAVVEGEVEPPAAAGRDARVAVAPPAAQLVRDPKAKGSKRRRYSSCTSPVTLATDSLASPNSSAVFSL